MITDSKAHRPFDARFYNRMFDAALEQHSTAKAVQGEAIRLVRRELLASGSHIPPIDLNRVAKRLRVQRIEVLPLAMRGRLVLTDAGVVIEINDSLSAWDQRHTIAHELAHLVLERDRVASSSAAGMNVKRRMAHGLIERLCDLCADEMLLPSEWLDDRLKRARPSLRVVLDISTDANAPVDIVATRVVNLAFQPWRAIWCKRQRGKYCLEKSIPQWDEAFLASVDVLESDDSPLMQCSERNEVVTGSVELRIRGEKHCFPSQCIRLADDSVFAILYTGCR
jgi:Zn-dependent peptidase ImmA (M78 family)